MNVISTHPAFAFCFLFALVSVLYTTLVHVHERELFGLSLTVHLIIIRFDARQTHAINDDDDDGKMPFFVREKKSPWGEHEIDYVLFATVPDKSRLTIEPHPDEVDDVKWVTKSRLLDMLGDESLLFSPWFRLIVAKWMIGDGGGGWWDDLERTMTTDDFCDYRTIHRFDPPVEHMGGGGDAGPMFGGGDDGAKKNVVVGDSS